MFFTAKRLKLYLFALLAFQFAPVVWALMILHTPRGHYIDLRSFYTAGYMLRTHQAALLYDYPTEQRLQNALVSADPRALPMMSPPFTALLFVPLSYLSFDYVHAVFAAVNVLLLLASAVLLKPFLAALYGRWSPAPTLLFLSFLPVALALIMGQLSFVLFLLYCACFVSLRRNRNLLAGLILALALIKFQIALPVALLFLLWRQWRFTVGFLTGSALLTALSIRITGLAPFLAYLHSLFSMTTSVTHDRTIQLRYAILPEQMPNLFGLVFTLTRGAAWSHILILALSLGLFLFTALQRPSLPLALLTAILVSYHLFFYDLTLLLLPLVLLVDHLLRAPAPSPTHRQPRNLRLLITQISLGALFLSCVIYTFFTGNSTCLFAVPILALTLASTWWPSLHGPPDPAPLPPLNPEPAALSSVAA